MAQQDGGVCDTTLSTGDEGIDECLSGLCCAELESCNAVASCAACLVGEGTACDENTPYQAWIDCYASRCADDICGSGLSFFADSGGTAYECNACAAQCCSCARGCVGEGRDDEAALCLDCLADPDACPDPAIAMHARNFRACTSELCVSECGQTDPAGGDAATCEAPSSGEGGAGGSAEEPVMVPPPPEKSSCACTAPGGRSAPPWALWGLALGVLGYRARRMKRSSSVSRCGDTSTTSAPSSSARRSTSDTAS